MKFSTTIEQEPGKNHAGIPVPPAIVDALGPGKRPAVVVTVGPHTYRTTIASMGGRFLISLSAANREAAGVVGGDTVEVELELDSAPLTVEVPESLAAALQEHAAAAAAFEALSNSRKSRITLSVQDAKTEETRLRRVAKAIDDLESGKA